MSSSSPLHNKRVMIPRGKDHAGPFSELVKKYGGIPIEIPMIAFRPAAGNPLEPVMKILDSYDWIIFTSNVTVETFFSFFIEKKEKLSPKIAVIGEKTREILYKKGIETDFMPSEYVAEGFIREFLPHIKGGEKILIPKGNLAREYIASSLAKHGVIVDEAIIYETFLPEESKEKLVRMLSDHEIDILAFTSPSTVGNFMKVVSENSLEERINECLVGCIGPITKEKAEALGLKVHASPPVYTVEEMLKSMMDYLEKQSIGGVNHE